MDAEERRNGAVLRIRDVDPTLNDLATRVIGAAMEVHSTLGPGFLESTYENALAVELTARGIGFVRQAVVEVGYKGVSVGEQRVDMLVGGRLVLELKATDAIQPVHLAQLRAYLVALNLPLGLVINFNSVHLRSGLKRVVNIR